MLSRRRWIGCGWGRSGRTRRPAAGRIPSAADAGAAGLVLCRWCFLVAALRAGCRSGHRRAVHRRPHASRPRHDREVLPNQQGGGRRSGRRPAGAAGRDRPARRAEPKARRRLCPPGGGRRHGPRPKGPEYEKKKAAYEAKKERRGRPSKPPDGTPPHRQTNLTTPVRS
jgi:hypothetical protein